MGRNPWEDSDDDVSALAGAASTNQPKRWLKFAIGLLVVAGLTFVAGYYIPLFRAHSALRDEFQTLSERRRTLDEALKNKERELARVTEEKAGLQAKIDERQEAEDAQKQGLDKVRTAVSSKIRGYETKGLAATVVEDGQVRAVLSGNLLFVPHSLKMGRRGVNVLCDVAKAAGKAELRVVAVTAADEPPSVALSAKYADRREVSAARAAVIGTRLTEACSVSSEGLEVVGLLDESRDKVHGVKLPAIVLELSPTK